ncbi:hypothetical protein FRACYDRAFT_245085 [Fragilariopsis cylindrus CCMP1102]|uniref:Uncharacterized protein n=1 Tax=Fragilariopsis cylindrus CCMP1102 TaxID=635003 RepID=A0A1E7F178_9STRA|nr:hypothetical protein FRACYDRAFT_245085 [Fragilariopsis cylindrus CCMP1102]|eukprot:OEU11961.1 hypothetical protein FRACYDRAFT_245085 [Fragilariopsis cylindrus CCMP1102]
MRMLLHLTQKVLSSATLSNEIHCCSFLVKNLAVCVPAVPWQRIKMIMHAFKDYHFLELQDDNGDIVGYTAIKLFDLLMDQYVQPEDVVDQIKPTDWKVVVEEKLEAAAAKATGHLVATDGTRATRRWDNDNYCWRTAHPIHLKILD